MITEKAMLKYMEDRFPSVYGLKHWNIRGKPITFDVTGRNIKKHRGHRPWQRDIIDDPHKDKVVRKSRQLGLSEMGCLENIHFVDTKNNVKSMLTFPRNRQVTDFVKTRLNPVFDSNEYFKSILDRNMDSIEVKRIRDSFMMFRSAWGGALGEGADIDFLAFDEYDRMTDGVEFAFQESMKSSGYGLLRRWSTPTIPGRGVDKLFAKSDQRFYMHKCEACNHYQIIDFEDNIMQVKPNGVNLMTDEIEDGTFIFVCFKCHKPLDRWYNGHWVAKHPDRKALRGYHISQLSAVWITADDFKRNELTYTSKQLFYNYVIGMPYASEGLIITDDDILALQRFEKPVFSRQDYKKIVVGIDWGLTNWACVLGIKEDGRVDMLRLFMFKDNPTKPLEPVNLLAASIIPYDPDLIIADAGYGADRNTYLMQLFQGRVWACQYNTYKDKSKPMDSWNENSRIINVDKTVKVQRMLHTIKARGIGTWRMDDDLLIFTKHMKNVRIMDEEDENGQVYQVATRIGPDHWTSALNYCLIGVDKLKSVYTPKQDFRFDFM
ncbi:terminase large subunit [Bacillus phage YungSlug]|nr:terminase large subunit [Bacillus phage YungSlug]